MAVFFFFFLLGNGTVIVTFSKVDIGGKYLAWRPLCLFGANPRSFLSPRSLLYLRYTLVWARYSDILQTRQGRGRDISECSSHSGGQSSYIGHGGGSVMGRVKATRVPLPFPPFPWPLPFPHNHVASVFLIFASRPSH